MINSHLLLNIIILLYLNSILPSKQHPFQTLEDGFTTRLIHRDSPLSPFYDHTISTVDRIRLSINRSISRLDYFQSPTSPSLKREISPKLIPENGEYLIKYSLGTPPIESLAIIDTGSEVIWLQCLPCIKCYNQTPPIYDPSKSSTHKEITCDSPDCVTHISQCNEDNNVCEFDLNYLDGSYIKGGLSFDTFYFRNAEDNNVRVGDLIFGCGHDNRGSFLGNQAGLVGLSRESFSLISQLNIKRFSYCMVPPNNDESGSRMYFGKDAVISGGQTPILRGRKIYYYLKLEGISVGDERIELPQGIFDIGQNGQGGFVIDTGTTYTTLRSSAFYSLIDALSKDTSLPLRKDPGNLFKLCFAGSFDDLESVPDITFHFFGADFVLWKETTFMSVGDELWCLTILPSIGELSILGNTQQQNYFVGYDLVADVVSFAPVDCALF